MIQSINPATKKLLKEYQLDSYADIELTIKKASIDYLEWKKLTFNDRGFCFYAIADELEKNADMHGKMISCEMGKPILESKAEILKCVWLIRYFAKHAENFLQSEEIKTEYSQSYIQYDPLGVIFGVMPWNFPYWQVFRFIVPAMMAGNTCIIKHASNVTGCSLLIEKLIKNNLSLKNAYNSLIVGSSDVSSIIENKEIKAISFTGSDYAGSQVAMNAGKSIKKVVLELGGSDPFIVLEDADIDRAAEVSVKARFLNAGQSCIAAKRFLVHEKNYDKFINKVEPIIKSLVIGNPLNEGTQIGPLAKYEIVEEIDNLVKLAIKDGAKCILGGESLKGCYYKPTLLIDVVPNMRIFKEETFGPVFCVTKISDSDEAIRFANNSDYGLGGSIWTKNHRLAQNMASEINTGAIFINDMTKSDPRLPFGGIGKSGYGIELSKYGIREFVNLKTIVIK